MEYIHAADSLAGVLIFLGGVVSIFILRPLREAINELRDAVKELRKDLRLSEERRHMMEIKLAEVDQRARAAHHRLDRLEGKADDVEHR
jgi:uncharacterized membrane protein YccC